tara:strand:- start:26 stop:706 length:681 start_codon:yes stop_codon:yes gene_type:complete
MEVAFLIPSTSRNRDWENIHETYLFNILMPTLCNMKTPIKIKVFVGYDVGDRIYREERINKFKHIDIEWFGMDGFKGNPCGIWNGLGEVAIQQGYKYFFVCGDDIHIEDSDWLHRFIVNLNLNNKIGFCAGWSNNDSIPTQFLIHKTHIDILGFIYPPEIHNWYCDNWMNDVYPQKYRYWNKDIKLLNCGGQPRYKPNNDKQLAEMLVRRQRPLINQFINKNKYMD